MFDAYFEALQNASSNLHKSIENLMILDMGCGRGEFLEYACQKNLNIEGCDFDPVCLEMSGIHAPCFAFNIETDYKLPKKYDVIVMSHVLEHLRCPVDFLQKIRQYCNFLIIGIPNPCRPNVVFNFAPRRQHYCNRGHYYSWDRSHFQNFLDLNRFTVISWHYDDFHLPNWRIINYGRKIGLQQIESFLKKKLPYLSTSHIVLVNSTTST